MDDDEFTAILRSLDPDLVQAALDRMPVGLMDALNEGQPNQVLASDLIGFAQTIDAGFNVRPHLAYLAARIDRAIQRVEEGESQRLIVNMPPRMGKSSLISVMLPLLLVGVKRWPAILASHDASLVTSWGRQVRRLLADRAVPGVDIASDAGAAAEWETTAGGKLKAVSVGQSITGRGAKALIVDDPHKDFIAAHSGRMRDNLWDWWLAVAQTRLEPPSLVIVVMTRWHEDDMVGRLLDSKREGDPSVWEVITFPAIAEEDDVLGRKPGDPLYSPMQDESRGEAIERWDSVRESVGSYVWAGLMQQRPAPEAGAIFDISWWQFWTTNPENVSENVVLFDPTEGSGMWLDSWDCSFKATASSDYVVGQRWVRRGADRFLVGQQRSRWTFTQTVDRMRAWAVPESVAGTGRFVHRRLVEEAANGAAVIDTLRREISGLKPVRATVGKEGRARAVTPEVESGNVFLPYPGDAGNEWVTELLSELRSFPNDVHDDQVDALTQALSELRVSSGGSVTVPQRAIGRRATHGRR